MDPLLTSLPPDLAALQSSLQAAVQVRQGNPLALLQLLRLLEDIHLQIRDGAFQDSLPCNRHELYTLLQDLEAQGEWPQIPRTRIETFLEMLKRQLDQASLDNRDPVDIAPPP